MPIFDPNTLKTCEDLIRAYFQLAKSADYSHSPTGLTDQETNKDGNNQTKIESTGQINEINDPNKVFEKFADKKFFQNLLEKIPERKFDEVDYIKSVLAENAVPFLQLNQFFDVDGDFIREALMEICDLMETSRVAGEKADNSATGQDLSNFENLSLEPLSWFEVSERLAQCTTWLETTLSRPRTS